MWLTYSDNLLDKIETQKFYEDFYKSNELLDFSNYWKGSSFHDDSNKLVVGKIEDQIFAMSIKGFTGLKFKMYSFVKCKIETRDTH